MPENKEIFDGWLTVRVNQKELDVFEKKSKRATGKDKAVLIREMVTSFNDGRLRIIPTGDQKNNELYIPVK